MEYPTVIGKVIMLWTDQQQERMIWTWTDHYFVMGKSQWEKLFKVAAFEIEKFEQATYLEYEANVKQIAVVYEAGAENARELLQVIRSGYRPNQVLAASIFPLPPGAPALLNRHLKDGSATVYVVKASYVKLPLRRYPSWKICCE